MVSQARSLWLIACLGALATTLAFVPHGSRFSLSRSSGVLVSKSHTTRPIHSQCLIERHALLFEDDSLQFMGPFSALTRYILNTVANLLRIQGEESTFLASESKQLLIDALQDISQNGISTPTEKRAEISSLVESLETFNPTVKPALSPRMNGYWKLLYTDFSPAATSSGKLGPFVGDVYQDLDSSSAIIKNVLDIKSPPIQGALVADQGIYDDQTWSITFDYACNAIAGISLPQKTFEPGKEIRLWKITYLDQDFRIMRARRVESSEEDSFIFILERDEAARSGLKLKI